MYNKTFKTNLHQSGQETNKQLNFQKQEIY